MNLNTKIWSLGILSAVLGFTAAANNSGWLYLLALACQIITAWFAYEFLRMRRRSGWLVVLIALFGILGIAVVYLIPAKEGTGPVEEKASTKFATLFFLLDFFGIFIIALAIIVPIRYFIFQPFIVSGSSMEPNFSNGQYLIIDELTYHLSSPKRGQVVVLRYPKDPKQFFIKRIVGLPGEKIEIDNGKVTIFNAEHPQGVTADELYLPNQALSYPHDPTIVGGNKDITLGSDQYFMMGDNRLASSDSRDWGPLPRAEMVGKVLIRVLPLNKFDVFNHLPAYNF